MTKTLTEQWREGTLPEGWYYTIIKGFTDKEQMMIDYYIQELHHFEIKPTECIKEVLAPVPSYDEYKRLQERLAIATKALKEYADRSNWIEGNFMCVYDGKSFADEESAEQALKEMEGVK